MKKLELSGKTFGNWVVLRASQRKSRSGLLWWCLCKCGLEKEVPGVYLKSGKSSWCRSCANYDRVGKNINQYRRFPESEVASRTFLSIYKNAARKRNLPFELTTEEFFNLISRNCHYCDSPPRSRTFKGGAGLNVHGVRSKPTAYTTNLNGVDRINSDLGYTSANCVSCCTKCNLMKRDFLYDKFLEQIRKIAVHMQFLTHELAA